MEIFPEKLTKIEFAIADEMRISVESLRSGSRTQEFARARHAVWTIAVDDLGYSYNRLKRLYEKDHTTVRHGVLKTRGTALDVQARRAVNERYPGLLNLGIARGTTGGQTAEK